MSQSPHIAIAILAAGASTRMGSPKQLLKWGEKSLIKHAIHTAKKTIVAEVIVVLGANAEVITSEIEDETTSIIFNEEWEQGLGKSIAFVSNYISKSKDNIHGLLIMLADQPFVTTDFLNKIIKTFNSGKHTIVSTSYNERNKGVPALFASTYFEELSQLSGDNGAKSIIEKYGDLVGAVTPKFRNSDIDTKADFERFSKE